MSMRKTYYERLAETMIKKMERRQMEAYYCPDRVSAVQKVLDLMPAGSSVAWGGSVTLTESGLRDALNPTYTVIKREEAEDTEEIRQVYSKICGCNYFLMSTNAMIDTNSLTSTARHAICLFVLRHKTLSFWPA